MTSQYLPLTEYSSKHRVSISTLRRRIKADEIKYVFRDGKYLILDSQETDKGNPAVASSSREVHRPSQKSEKTEAVVSRSKAKSSPAPLKEPSADSASFKFKSELRSDTPKVEWNEEFSGFDLRDRQEPILTAANRLLTELKKAYSTVLQEKEEQILLLREEVSDLKTLVRALESEHSKTEASRRAAAWNKNRSR